MDDMLETRFRKLERLVKWEHIDELNSLILDGVSPRKLELWCHERGFKISHPKLYEYKEMLLTAINKGITVERMLGVGLPKRSPISLLAMGIVDSQHKVKNELEVLDAIIQRGFTALTLSPEVKINDAMRAIELKNKLTAGSHGGYTSYGLDKLRELETAKFQAMVQVVLKYIPEEAIPELELAIESAERDFYETQAPDLLQEWEQAKLADDEALTNG